MIVSQFTIRTEHTPPTRWFWVRIYATQDALLKAARKYAGGDPAVYAEDCVGCVQEVTPWIHETHDPADQDYLPSSALKWPANGYAGVIRFCSDHLTPEIIAHECVHAAVTVLRMSFGACPRLEGMLAPERPVEEALAYAAGQLNSEMHRQLYAHGFA